MLEYRDDTKMCHLLQELASFLVFFGWFPCLSSVCARVWCLRLCVGECVKCNGSAGNVGAITTKPILKGVLRGIYMKKTFFFGGREGCLSPMDCSQADNCGSRLPASPPKGFWLCCEVLWENVLLLKVYSHDSLAGPCTWASTQMYSQDCFFDGWLCD